MDNHAGNNHVRGKPEEEYRSYCISPTVKHLQSVMAWGCMAENGIGRLELISGMMNTLKYIDELEKKCCPVHVPCFLMSTGFSS